MVAGGHWPLDGERSAELVLAAIVQYQTASNVGNYQTIAPPAGRSARAKAVRIVFAGCV